MKSLLADYSLAQIKDLMVQRGQKPFRALQLYQGIMQGKQWEEMTNLPQSFKEEWSQEFDCQGVRILERLEGRDGTRKYLFALRDDNVVEGVVMPYRYGNTICISTQVGCRMGCAFCASGIDGLVRNLSAGEMLGEVVCANRDWDGDLKNRAIHNIVLMGSGEPFDNYDNVADFLRLVNSEEGLHIGVRSISLSTCGLLPGVQRLIDDQLWVTLTFSLHAPNDELRRQIMPVAKAYSVAQIMQAARQYFEASGRRVIFEYTLIKGVNDSVDCARQLAALMRGFPTHVNLIVLNYVKEKGLRSTERTAAEAFLAVLVQQGVSATIRRTMGADIDGACGQLRRKYIG